MAITNYLGVSGTNYQTRDGVFPYDLPVQLAEISDGQSDTLLVGERPPSPDRLVWLVSPIEIDYRCRSKIGIG